MTPALVRALLAGNQSRSGTATVLAWVAPGGALWLAPLGTPAPDCGEPMSAAWVRVDVAGPGGGA